jgi:sucrose-6-phosphate hydrolase SacC (GH32 family)
MFSIALIIIITIQVDADKYRQMIAGACWPVNVNPRTKWLYNCANFVNPIRMTNLLRITAASILAVPLSYASSSATPTNEIIARATTAMQAAVPRAQADPTHPQFHVTSPAQWMNDPNGPIYYKGYYHLFYQLYPFSDRPGPRYWGHVRSRDLAKWESLPIALWPSAELGESEIWSGCCTINGLGQPMAFYTSIAPGTSAGNHAAQWAAIGDDDLVTWRKSPDNPVLSESLHSGKKIYDWRDPFIFRHQSRTFLVTGGNLNEAKGGEAVVNIYEAQNPALTRWLYRGVLFHLPEGPTAECPNFFQLGHHWVLFASPYGKVQYFVGDFDAETCRFQPHTHGFADFGPNFYAPNTMQVPDGRRILWGWVNGFPEGHGWNGCLTLPRVLSLSADERLQQSPAPQLAKLRGHSYKGHKATLSGAPTTFQLPATNTFEISANLSFESAESIELSLQSDTDAPMVMHLSPAEFKMPDVTATLTLPANARELDLRIFIDRSVLEVFVNQTVCATKIIAPLGFAPTMQLRALGGTAKANRVEAWPIKTIW